MRLRNQKHVLYPDFVASVEHLPVAALKARGVKVLAFDLDHTLAPGWSHQIGSEVAASLAELRQAGFRILIASNTVADISYLGETLGATVVPARGLSRKPMRRYFRRVVAAAGCEPGQVAMVGDRIVNDMIGANLAGLVTVKADPIGRKGRILHRYYDRYVRRRDGMGDE